MRCPICGREPDAHPITRCLDSWVHTEFLRLPMPLPPDEVPLYSQAGAGDAILDPLIDARQWPTGARFYVANGRWVVDSPEGVIADDRSVAAALCRAAVATLPQRGTEALTTFYRLR
jgi:hypothetical protein